MSLEALALLQEANCLRPVDVHFARQLVRHADSDPDAIALLAALLSVELGRGHVCVELGALDGKPFAGLETELAPRLDAARLGAALRSEPRLCAHEGDAEPRPLVRDGDRVYLHRYWLSECRVAARLRALAARPPVLLVAIVRVNGAGVCGLHSNDFGFVPARLEAGRFGFAVRFEPLELLPGQYLFRAHALDPEGLRLFDTVACEFSVTGEAGVYGIVRPPHRWLPGRGGPLDGA